MSTERSVILASMSIFGLASRLRFSVKMEGAASPKGPGLSVPGEEAGTAPKAAAAATASVMAQEKEKGEALGA